MIITFDHQNVSLKDIFFDTSLPTNAPVAPFRKLVKVGRPASWDSL